jgi:DNA/RNA endonuclease YhcR with UshA esterase domain
VVVLNGESEGAPEIVITDADQIQNLDDDARAVPEEPPPVPVSEALAGREDVVPWQEAGDYIGQEVTVGGTVVRTYNSGKAAFLNFDKDWRGKFSVVIFASDFDNFPQPPHKMYLNKTILVTGKVKEYKGAPEIIVESPEQIEIVGEETIAAAPSSPTPPPATPSGPPQGVVPWQEAGNYLGQTITVEGRIIRTKDIGSITFLNFSKHRGDFVAIVRAADYDNFPAPPAELYDGKKVWITGEISEYKGTPQMVLHSPDQVEVFD